MIDALSPWGVLSSWTDFRGHLSTIEVPFSRLEGVIQLIPKNPGSRHYRFGSGFSAGSQPGLELQHFNPNIDSCGAQPARHWYRNTKCSQADADVCFVEVLASQMRGDQSCENERNTH